MDHYWGIQIPDPLPVNTPPGAIIDLNVVSKHVGEIAEFYYDLLFIEPKIIEPWWLHIWYTCVFAYRIAFKRF